MSPAASVKLPARGALIVPPPEVAPVPKLPVQPLPDRVP